MYAIYGNMDPSIYIYIYKYVYQYTPVMLAYIPAPWILWVYIYIMDVDCKTLKHI